MMLFCGDGGKGVTWPADKLLQKVLQKVLHGQLIVCNSCNTFFSYLGFGRVEGVDREKKLLQVLQSP